MGKKKDIVHAPKKCGGILEVTYNDNGIPLLICDKCNHEIRDWLMWEEKYKNLWQEEESWNSEKDHISCILGYFCAIYLDHYKVEYTLSLNDKGLFRGPEANVLRKVYKMLGSDAWAVKDYIDFIFARKVQKRKKRITSLSYLCVQDFVQEFKLARHRAKMVDRDTKIPEKMSTWVQKFAPNVFNFVELSDFGDLNLLLSHYKDGHYSDSDIAKFVSKLEKMNYIDSKLSILNWRDR